MIYSANPLRYEQMQYKYCGNSGLKIPLISLGLWHNFGDVDSFSVGRQIILKAFDFGITHFDLANNYGPSAGSAESTMGNVLKKDLMPYRDELIISTKAGYYMWPGPYGDWGSKKYLIASLDQSLKRLGLDYVDIFYSHRYDPNTPLEETMEALAQSIRQGKALYVGISNYPPEQTEKAYDILRSLGVRCLIHQNKYSMFMRDPEQGLFQTLKRIHMGCIVFSPLAQGLLTDRYLKGIPKDSRASKPHGFLKKEQITEEVVARVKQLNEIARQRDQTLAQLALVWVLKQGAVTSALIGASSVKQLQVNVDTLQNLEISKNELNRIEEILKN